MYRKYHDLLNDVAYQINPSYGRSYSSVFDFSLDHYLNLSLQYFVLDLVSLLLPQLLLLFLCFLLLPHSDLGQDFWWRFCVTEPPLIPCVVGGVHYNRVGRVYLKISDWEVSN